ncbi:MAG TPA: putative DNA modification/repair radical SAM protein [Candidatus Omnitrophota bacterium]|nr:putative DNA modification/repair radical SAM protein [Candidatus Omnitrophota bacterium]HPB67381.1 putative DNA modification/repair radical SAM protein [Candidatus Omnitrophota bacterium]HQO57870.1 putative DNA modification/repair radical SAM protein [Candidatus Omnitrophota bacterium]
MHVLEKLSLLANSAKYDVSCASSGSSRQGGALGRASLAGVCHSWSADGRCISLLKVLFSNNCIFDCAYCINRRSNNVCRAQFTPGELAQLTINFYRRNYIEGLFLSSAIVRTPDHTMELLNSTMRLLRETYQFRGYIHVKVIPGASPALVDAAGRLADRVSVNIELPSPQSLSLLAPQKSYPTILSPMRHIHNIIVRNKEDNRNAKHGIRFAPAGQSTQMIIGASPERDLQILKLSAFLYQTVRLRRVYYSAYVPVNSGKNLPALPRPPLLREHRLYQADWLLRFYGFDASEILDEQHPDFEAGLDPKVSWALRHIGAFPLDINTASYRQLVRIPGVGVRSAARIMAVRKVKKIRFEDLKKLRVVLKRAQYFILVNGRYHGDVALDPEEIRRKLDTAAVGAKDSSQLTLFGSPEENPRALASSVTGEL